MLPVMTLTLMLQGATLSPVSCQDRALSPEQELGKSCLQAACVQMGHSLLPLEPIRREVLAESAAVSASDRSALDDYLARYNKLRERVSSAFSALTPEQLLDKLKPEQCDRILSDIGGITTSYLAPDGRQNGEYVSYVSPDQTPQMQEALRALHAGMQQQMRADKNWEVTQHAIPLADAKARVLNLVRSQLEGQPVDAVELGQASLALVDTASSWPQFDAALYGLRAVLNQNDIEGFPSPTYDCRVLRPQLLSVLTQLDVPKFLSADNTRELWATGLSAQASSCQIARWAEKKMALSAEDAASFDKLLDRVVEGYRTKIFPRFSAETAKKLDSVDLKAVVKRMPPDETELRLSALTEESQESLKTQESVTEVDVSSLTGLLQLSSNLPAMPMCASMNFGPTDYAIVGAGFSPTEGESTEGTDEDAAEEEFEDEEEAYGVYVSPFTMKFAHAGTVAHEYAHWLAGLFIGSGASSHSVDKYRRFRQCVAARNPSPSIMGGIFDGESAYTEEDVADELGTLASGQGQDDFCNMFNNSAVGGMLAMETPAVAEMVEGAYGLRATPGDSHSSVLRRILVGLRLLGQDLPNSCQELVRSSDVDLDVDCLKYISKDAP